MKSVYRMLAALIALLSLADHRHRGCPNVAGIGSLLIVNGHRASDLQDALANLIFDAH
jgi:hypothetical protein